MTRDARRLVLVLYGVTGTPPPHEPRCCTCMGTSQHERHDSHTLTLRQQRLAGASLGSWWPVHTAHRSPRGHRARTGTYDVRPYLRGVRFYILLLFERACGVARRLVTHVVAAVYFPCNVLNAYSRTQSAQYTNYTLEGRIDRAEVCEDPHPGPRRARRGVRPVRVQASTSSMRGSSASWPDPAARRGSSNEEASGSVGAWAAAASGAGANEKPA